MVLSLVATATQVGLLFQAGIEMSVLIVNLSLSFAIGCFAFRK
jgi:hypothetical protein